MAKIVVSKLKPSGKRSAVTEKRIRDSNGQLLTLRTIDGHSDTFGSDLTYVFTRNVAKARRENKQVTGVLDRGPVKG